MESAGQPDALQTLRGVSGARPLRDSVWSAWSLLPLSHAVHGKAPVTFAHALGPRTTTPPLPAFGHPLPRFGRERGQGEGRCSWKASFGSCTCIGTMNPRLTPPRRGTEWTRTNVCSPPGRGRGWVGSWRG